MCKLHVKRFISHAKHVTLGLEGSPTERDLATVAFVRDHVHQLILNQHKGVLYNTSCGPLIVLQSYTVPGPNNGMGLFLGFGAK